MNLDEATQAATVVEFRGQKVEVPPFVLGDFIEWGARIDQEQIEQATKGMSVDVRFQHMTFYSPAKTPIMWLVNMIRSAAGVEAVLNKCLPQGRVIAEQQSDKTWKTIDPPREVSEDWCEQLKKLVKPKALVELAVKLAPTQDNSIPGEGEGTDPSPLAETREKKQNRGSLTGPSESQSSTPPILKKTRSDSPLLVS